MTTLAPENIIITPLIEPLKTYPITVLLIDDQQIIAEKVRSMLVDQKDIAFHYCTDPTQAIDKACEVNPTVILQDLVMPDINGLELTRYFRAHEKTHEIPLIVLSNKEDPETKAEAFSLGANDYVVKLPDKLELIARIRYHSNGYIRLLERNEAYEKLRESQRLLNDELTEAAEYVRSLLPPPIKEKISASWQFIPSKQLGGDALGYHWIDDEHFAIYLLDVCGHGVGAALLSISVINVLRSQSLPNTDFREPVPVMKALNSTFSMEKQNNMFFTLWYGVWNSRTNKLNFGSAGHPPAMLFSKGKEPQLLRTEGLVVGAEQDVQFTSLTIDVPPASQLYVFSDGVYEITKPDQTMLRLDDMIEILKKASEKPEKALATVQNKILSEADSNEVSDDYSILQIIFPS